MGERCSSPVGPGQLKLRPKSIFVFSIPPKAFNTTIWGLAAFDGKNSGEARFMACLRALNSEEACTSLRARLIGSATYAQ